MYCPASVIMMRQAIPCPTPSSLQARRIIRLLHLPDIGIKGNSHFLMQEKNNKEILKLALDWLHEKGLDK